jgi:hypothetical protein
MQLDELRRMVREIARERFGDDMPVGSLVVDLVNLDRGGKRGLVYLDGAIVLRGNQVLDGHHRLHAIAKSSASEEMRLVQVGDDPVPDAIYVPEGPIPDYLVDQASCTILIGWARAGREATPDEIRSATVAAIAELFGN